MPKPARPGGVLLLRRTCLSGLSSTLTARSHQTPSRLPGGYISSTTATTSFQQIGTTSQETTIFSSVPTFLVITNLGDQKTYFGFLAISRLSSIPHLPPPASHLQPTPKMYPSIQLESRPPAKYLVPAQGHPSPDILFRVPTTLCSTVPVRRHKYQKPLHQTSMFQHLQY